MAHRKKVSLFRSNAAKCTRRKMYVFPPVKKKGVKISSINIKHARSNYLQKKYLIAERISAVNLFSETNLVAGEKGCEKVKEKI